MLSNDGSFIFTKFLEIVNDRRSLKQNSFKLGSTFELLFYSLKIEKQEKIYDSITIEIKNKEGKRRLSFCQQFHLYKYRYMRKSWLFNDSVF